MSRFLFDTNICIYYLEGSAAIISYMNELFKQPSNSLVLSVITEAELFSSPKVYGNKELVRAISRFIADSDEVAEVTRDIGFTAGQIRSYFHQSFNRKIKLFVEIMAKYRIPYVNPVKSSA